MKRVLISGFISAILFSALATVTFAHAKVDHCKPEPGSASPTAPSEVRCWFTEEIDTKQSTMSVADSNGQRVDNNDARVDLNDPDHKQMFVTVRTLAQGVYKVSWKAVTPDDNATTEGEWYFGVGQVSVPTLAPQTTEAAPRPAATPIVPAATPVVPAATTTSGVSDSGQTYVVAGLVLLGAAAIAFMARQVLR